jgi:hypothetical protein
MNNVLRNVLAVIAGWIVGSIANLVLVIGGSMIVPAPAGVNIMDAESLKAGAHLFEAKHFIFPFFAHAAGALVGGLVAALIGASSRMILALIVGVLFLIGGILAAFMIPAPAWFIALDLCIAYIPMALLGWKLSGRA